MTKGERTRTEILEKTAPLFNTKGFEGTSLADLCQATGLTKGALYGAFKNKEALANAAFEYSVACVVDAISSIVNSKQTYRAKLLACAEFFSTYVNNPPVKGGCPLLNAAVEADDSGKKNRKRVAVKLESMIDFLAGLIEDGKHAGEFKRSVHARETATVIFCAMEGAIMFARAVGNDHAMQCVTKHVKRLVNEITTTKEEQ